MPHVLGPGATGNLRFADREHRKSKILGPGAEASLTERKCVKPGLSVKHAGAIGIQRLALSGNFKRASPGRPSARKTEKT